MSLYFREQTMTASKFLSFFGIYLLLKMMESQTFRNWEEEEGTEKVIKAGH